ncbi:8849_t:CDS:2, partial [Ambispora leptoticha]
MKCFKLFSTYEQESGQLFTARMGKNFRFPRNILEGVPSITSLVLGPNPTKCLVHNQRVIEYGQMYDDDDKLDQILEAMPGALQIPVDQTKLPRNPPAKMVTVQRINNGNDYKVRVRIRRPNEGLIVQINHDFYDTQRKKLYTCVVDP